MRRDALMLSQVFPLMLDDAHHVGRRSLGKLFLPNSPWLIVGGQGELSVTDARLTRIFFDSHTRVYMVFRRRVSEAWSTQPGRTIKKI